MTGSSHYINISNDSRHPCGWMAVELFLSKEALDTLQTCSYIQLHNSNIELHIVFFIIFFNVLLKNKTFEKVFYILPI